MGLGVSTQLDQHGTLEFWAAVYSVHAHALRDYCTLYQELQQLLERQQAEQGGATAHERHSEGKSPECQQLMQMLKKICGLINGFQFAHTSCKSLSRASAGHERRVRALLRSDTLKSYAALFDMVARGRLTRSLAYDVGLMLGTLLTLFPDSMGVYAKPCESKDDFDMELYGAFVKAAGDSHVLDHACRAALRLSDFVAQEHAACGAAGAAAGTTTGARWEQIGNVCSGLRSMRNNINKVLSFLPAPLAGQQALGALHPRPLAAPRTGTDPSLLALLPAVRGLLSGTGVQMWVAKQLLDVANAVQAEVVGGSGLGSGWSRMFGLSANDPFLGLPLAARLQPHLFTATDEHPTKGPDRTAIMSLLRSAMNVSATTWQVTISGPLGPAVAAQSSASSGGAAAGGGAAASGGAAAGGGAAAVPYRLPDSIPFSAAQVCSIVGAALSRVLMPGWSVTRPEPGVDHCQGEIAQALLLLSRLAQELRARQAQHVLQDLWGMLNGWLAGLSVQSLTAARQVLPQLGALLLHEWPGERELAEAAARRGGDAEASDYPLSLRAAEGFVVLIHDTATSWLAAASEPYGVHYCRLIADLVDALLRQSCVLPVLIVHNASPSALDLVVTLRAMCNDLRRKGLFAEAEALRAVLLHQLELLAAVWMRPLPDGMSSSSSSSRSSSAARGAGGPTAAAGRLVPGAPVPDAVAAAIDSTAASLLTKASREQVPKARLRRMWLAAHGLPDKEAILPAPVSVVFIVTQLLPLLLGLRQELAKEDVPKDRTLALTRVYTAVALQALLANASAPLRSSPLMPREARAESWLALLVSEDFGALAWAAAALDAAVRRQWREGQAAALDLLELLVLLLPTEGMLLRLQVLADEKAMQPPSGPTLPLRIGLGWLQQQGRGELAAATRERHLGFGGVAAPDGATARLSDQVLAKHRAAALPELPCPADAAAQVAAETEHRPCAAPGCSKLQDSGGVPITQRCSRCRAVSYCSQECQKAHWKAGHREGCQHLGTVWKALGHA